MDLSLIAKVLIICLGLLEAVSSTPQLYTAPDGQVFLIERELKETWYGARHVCACRGYQPVKIDSAEKNTAIINLLKNINESSSDLWTGGNDEYSPCQDIKRKFYWNTSGKQLNFKNWADNGLSYCNGQQHFVCIRTSGGEYKWYSAGNQHKMGFICENTYNNDLKHKCNVLINITSSIFDELDQAHSDPLYEIDRKIRNIEQVGYNRTELIEQLQNTTQMAIKKILDDQQKKFDQIAEKMLQQVNELNAEIKRSTADISAQVGEKQDEMNKIC